MKVLIANRGEIAVRVIRACRELGYRTVAVYSEPDRSALHVISADEAMPIGAAPSRESDLRIDRILDAAKKTGADAIHPGYGFLAENADFARACRDAGVTFIGPSPESIDAMGSKTESRQRMIAAGVPVVPGHTEPVKSFDEIEASAKSTGAPIRDKARAAAAVNYYSTGTIECLMGPDREFYFLEMNTRLQVEHPVTEMVWGVDLVKEQLCIARGEKLSFTQADLAPNGHAIECRIYAEDPSRKFAPSPGLIRYIDLPQGPGVRNDNGVYAGYTVPVFYDPMLSKLIAHAASRDEAIARMRRALTEYRVEGIMTTIPFFTVIMNHPDFKSANFDTGFIDHLLSNLDFARTAATEQQIDAAIAAAAIFAFEESQKVQLPVDAESQWRSVARREALR